jgi:hypothetical protein
MPEKPTGGPLRSEIKTLTRRDILAGAAVTACAIGMPQVLAASPRVMRERPVPVDMPLRRFMAAAAALGGGCVLVTGGYDRPWSAGPAPNALDTAMIFDAARGQWWAAAPMLVPRARHAAVSLPDGRVAVLGGVALSPTASVEIYDPRSNTWEIGSPLAQPRYDHSAVCESGSVYVLGGSSLSMITGVEVVRVERAVEEFSPSY